MERFMIELDNELVQAEEEKYSQVAGGATGYLALMDKADDGTQREEVAIATPFHQCPPPSYGTGSKPRARWHFSFFDQFFPNLCFILKIYLEKPQMVRKIT